MDVPQTSHQIPHLIMCAGKNKRYAESALKYGWLYGAQLPCTIYAPVWFVDQNWRKPDREKYMQALAKHKPTMATVIDLERYDQFEEVMDWAEEASRYAKYIVIIPKIFSIIDDIPERINTSKIIVGYSVPTKFGGSSVPLWEFRDRPVHLLGGSPHKQMELFHYLNVFSADGNMASKMATKFVSFWSKKKGKTGHWVQLQEIGRGDEQGAPYTAFEMSMQNIMEAWQQFKR